MATVSGTFLGDLTDRQSAVQREAREVLQREWSTRAFRDLIDSQSGYSPELWQTLCGLGWPGTTIPERFGGAGGTVAELAGLAEELGRALAPVPLVANAAGAHAVLMVASQRVQQAFLPGASSGSGPLALAIRERALRVDPLYISLSARPDGNRFLLTGTKLFVPYADLAAGIVTATLMDDVRRSEPAAILVPGDTPQLRKRRLKPLDWSSLWEVEYAGALVRGDYKLCDGEPADELMEESILYEGVANSAELLGVAKAALDLAVDYAKNRVAFGRPIGAFQAVKHKLVDLRVAVEIAAALNQAAVHAIVTDAVDRNAASARAVFWAIDALRGVPQGALQVFGGIGFTWDHDIHLYLRRAATLTAMLGERKWYADHIVRQLTADAARPADDAT